MGIENAIYWQKSTSEHNSMAGYFKKRERVRKLCGLIWVVSCWGLVVLFLFLFFNGSFHFFFFFNQVVVTP